jgi:hypothetical protein
MQLSRFLKAQLIAFFLLFSLSLFGQSEGLVSFNTQRLKVNKTAMTILGSWAVGNMATGAVMMGRTEGREKYFHQMNIAWNAVNLGLATFGYLAAVKADPASIGMYESIQQHQGIQKTLLFNAGLDIGYIMGGLYMVERSRRVEKKPERLEGWGRSLVLQGAFLFAFDVGVYLVHASNNKKLEPLLSSISFSGDSIGLNLMF